MTAFEKLGRGEGDDGRIIKDENEEVIRVTGSTYLQLLQYCGGWPYLLLLNFVMLAFVLCKIKTDYTIGLWAKDTDLQQENFTIFTVMVFSYASSAALMQFFRCVIVFVMGIKASTKVHLLMI